MSKWTLEYGGVEKALAAWLICSDAEVKHANKQKTTFTFRTSEWFDGASPLQFAFGEQAILRRDRTGSGTAWSGGSIAMRGWFDSPRRTFSDGKHYVHYQLHNVWWFFERHTYQQRRKQFVGWTDNDPHKPPMFQVVLSSESYLGESPEEEMITNGEQIEDVINWLNECYNPTKRGATVGRDDSQDIVGLGGIEPRVMHPRGKAQTALCCEVIFDFLRSSPDAVVYCTYSDTATTIHVRTMAKWNYATSPPTFLDYTNLPEITATLSSDQEKDIEVQACEMRQLPGVIIKYKTFTLIDASYWPYLVTDKFPLDTDDYTPEISAHCLALPGFTLIRMRADVVTEPLAGAFSADADILRDWWLRHDPTLDSDRILRDSIKIRNIEAYDDNDAPLDLALFPNQLKSSLPGWAQRTAFMVTIHAEQEFEKYDKADKKTKVRATDKREVKVRLWATNAVTKPYTGISHIDPGITSPQGLAESMYRAVAALQHRGSVNFSRAQVRGDIYIGCRLKAVGPHTTFTNLMPQTLIEKPFNGQLIVSFDPASMADADWIIELALVSRWRNVQDFPSGRSDGSTGGGTEVNLSGDGSYETCAHQIGGESFMAATSPASF